MFLGGEPLYSTVLEVWWGRFSRSQDYPLRGTVYRICLIGWASGQALRLQASGLKCFCAGRAPGSEVHT